MARSLSLTVEQSAAVNDTHSRLLLVAAAGSGKTEVLARRIERILRESPGEAFRVLAVTYTVKAAEEMRGRVRTMVAEDSWRVDCETLHGFALEWLMRYGASVGVGPQVIVFSDDIDRLDLIARYLRTLRLSSAGAPPETLKRILAAIDESRTLSRRSEIPDTRFDELGVALPELYDAYVGALTEAGGIDFPGMLSKLSEVLDVDAWVGANFHRTYRHVLVDEGQDLTHMQSRVLRKLVGPEVNLFVVADDRQAINGYAGGDFANARALVGADAVTMHLRHNFRCARSVIDAAERVAARLLSTQESLVASPQESLAAAGAPPGDVQIEAMNDSSDEAVATTLWIDALLRDGLARDSIAEGEDPRIEPENIAVIARARWLLEPVIDALTRRGQQLSLNFEASGFLRTPEGRLFLEALAIVADPSDRPARRRFLDELVMSAPQQDVTDGDSQWDPISVMEQASVPDLVEMAVHLKEARENESNLDATLGALGLRFSNSVWREDAKRVEQVWAKYRSAVVLQQRSIRGFLRYVSREQLAKPTDPGIRILTIHRVKGLEFKAVALVGAYEGALPDYRARTADQIDGERRGLYVAMTRAQRALRVSWPQTTVDRWGRIHKQSPSRFLVEAGLITNHSA